MRGLQDLSAQHRVELNNKFSANITYRRREMMNISNQIFDWVQSHTGTDPRIFYKYRDFHLKYHDQDFVTQHAELIRYAYSIRRTNKAVYSVFQDDRGQYKTQINSVWYNKNRLDFVWLYRKVKLIRKSYLEYFEAHPELRQTKHPVHITLTLPHTQEGYQGDKFYYRKLLHFFHEMRRQKFWKQAVYGGEYGIETTKGKNGYHIHLHSLTMLHIPTGKDKKEFVNRFREAMNEVWQKMTGGYITGCETIYWLEKTGTKSEVGSDGKLKVINTWKKHYINSKSSTEEYIRGVMECIKYHFKSSALKHDDGGYDLESMSEILNATKNMRYYSRFGAFYGEKSFSFNKVKEDGKDEALPFDYDLSQPLEDQIEPEVADGDSSRSVVEMINPFTLQPAREHEYYHAIGMPERMQVVRSGGKYHIKAPPDTLLRVKLDDIKRIVRGMVKGDLDRFLDQVDHGYYYYGNDNFYYETVINLNYI